MEAPFKGRATPPLMVGVAAFLLGLVVSAFLVWQTNQFSIYEKKISVALVASSVAHDVEDTITHALTAAHALAALVHQGNGHVPNFSAIAGKLLPHYPGVAELALAPGGIITSVAPLAGNEMAVGLDLFNTPAQRKEALLARVSEKLTLAGPLELVQGGTGIVARLPVFLGDANGRRIFWGLTIVVLRLPETLGKAHLSNLDEPGLAYELWRIHPDSGEKQNIARNSTIHLIEPVNQSLRIPNATWTLSVAPMKGWSDPLALSLKTALGLLFSLMLGYLTKFFVEMKNQKKLLEARVALRTSEIQAAQAKLQAMLDTIPDLVWLKNVDGVYLSCNPRFERLFGAREAEIIGKTDYDFVSQELADSFREHDRRAMAAGKPSINEEWLTFSGNDNSRGLFETIKAPMTDAQGRLVGVLGIARDITTRVLAERALLESQQQAQLYLNIASVMLVAADVEGRITLINRKGCETLGAPEAYVLGKDWFETFLPEHVQKSAREKYQKLMQGKVELVEYMEYAIVNRRGEKRSIAWHNALLLDKAGNPTGVLASGEDITERQHYIAQLEHKALYDNLTDLPNRTLLIDRLKLAIDAARRDALPLVVIAMKIARLKEVNEILGHHNGDLVIKEVAKRVAQTLRATDTVAHLSGDEFVILLPGDNEKTVGYTICKIQSTMEPPAVIDGGPLDIEVNMGVAVYPQHGEEPSVLLSHADAAMRIAKTEVGGIHIYESGNDPHSRRRRLSLLGELRLAINQNKLVLYYHPQIDITSGKIMGLEALVRWPRTAEDLILPLEFIPLAEQTGLIRPLTLWILEEAARQCARWQAAGFDLKISINLSVRNLLDPSLPNILATILANSRISANSLILEVTESAVMLQPERALKILTQLSEMGTGLSVDDFGTGYSSLAYLNKLPVSELKIDQSFVFGMVKNENDGIIVRSTIDLAHNLGLKVVAEGVEDQQTLKLLARLGCDRGQGYLFAKPMHPLDFPPWLSRSPWGIPGDSHNGEKKRSRR